LKLSSFFTPSGNKVQKNEKLSLNEFVVDLKVPWAFEGSLT
jgi:hypothetical protein